MVIQPLYGERNMTGKHVVVVEEAYKGGYRAHRDALLIKIEGREGTFYVANGLANVQRNVLECTRPIRAAYARINGLKVADIERAHAEWKANGKARERQENIKQLKRIALRMDINITIEE